METIKYRSDIDGLRAVAVLPVLLFHLEPWLAPGGYLGVDVFFVISGFLIAKIILRQMEAGDFSFRRFYLRRLKRLFPVSAAVISTTMAVGYFALYLDEWKSLMQQALSSLFCYSNYFFWTHSKNYWGESAENMALLHTWSLSIEEQFYLLFPLCLLALMRFLRKRLILALAISLVASLALSAVASQYAQSANFYWLPTRAWELLAGCLLAACQIRRGNGEPNAKIALLGLAMILVAVSVHWVGLDLYTVGQCLATLGTALVLWKSLPNAGLAGRVLSLAPVVFIGKISYSLYLWHWPLFVITRKTDALPLSAVFALALLLGALSYWLIEQQTRYLSDRRFAVAFAVGVALLAVTLPMPYYLHRPQVSFEIADSSPWKAINLQPAEPAHYQGRSGTYQTGLLMTDLPEGQRLDVLLLGDSHSLTYMAAVAQVGYELGLTYAFYGAAATSPFFIEDGKNADVAYHSGWTDEQRLDFDRNRRAFIKRYQPRHILVSARWENYLYVHETEGLRQLLANMVNEFPAAEFIFIGQPPVLPFGQNRFDDGVVDHIAWRKHNETLQENTFRKLANELLAAFADQHERVRFLELDDLLIDESGIRFLKDGVILYDDDDHLSSAGALVSADRLREFLAEPAEN